MTRPPDSTDTDELFNRLTESPQGRQFLTSLQERLGEQLEALVSTTVNTLDSDARPEHVPGNPFEAARAIAETRTRAEGEARALISLAIFGSGRSPDGTAAEFEPAECDLVRRLLHWTPPSDPDVER